MLWKKFNCLSTKKVNDSERDACARSCRVLLKCSCKNTILKTEEYAPWQTQPDTTYKEFIESSAVTMPVEKIDLKDALEDNTLSKGFLE